MVIQSGVHIHDILTPKSWLTIGITILVAFVSYLCFQYVKALPEQAIPYHIEPPAECDPGWNGNVVENPSIKIQGSDDIQCYCPATGWFLGVIKSSTKKDIDLAIQQARIAQKQWAKTSFAERRRVLRTLLEYILTHKSEIITACCLDSGKTRLDAVFGEIHVTAAKIHWTLKYGETSLSPSVRPTASILSFYKRNTIIYEPLGVLAACISWNYPFHNFLGPVIASIFSGNAIVVKCSERTAWSSIKYFIQIVRGALRACGHDEGLVQVVCCWPDVAEYLTSHSGISHITFIGSRAVGKEVAKSAAKGLIPVVAELGGKDPAVVLDYPSSLSRTGIIPDREMNRIISLLMRGTFQSAGQNCVGIERIICLPKNYDSVISLLEQKIKNLRQGPPHLELDVGASISDGAFSHLEALITDATANGARLLCGGKRHEHPDFVKGHYFQPTLIVDVTKDMAIAKEELFAPIAVVMRAESIDDAIEIANSCQDIYALGASVFGCTKTSSGRKDVNRCIKEVKAGMISVNDFAAYYPNGLPFGGVAGSGYGRFGGEEGLRGLCNIKAVCEDRWNGLLVKTDIPKPMTYPVQDFRAVEMANGIVDAGFANTMTGKVSGIRQAMNI